MYIDPSYLCYIFNFTNGLQQDRLDTFHIIFFLQKHEKSTYLLDTTENAFLKYDFYQGVFYDFNRSNMIFNYSYKRFFSSSIKNLMTN